MHVHLDTNTNLFNKNNSRLWRCVALLTLKGPRGWKQPEVIFYQDSPGNVSSHRICVCVCVCVCLCVCVCVLGHTMRCRCGLNLHTCILFMEAKTHSRQSRVCTAEGKLWNTVTYSVYSWLGRISKYARTNGKATWPPLADFVCSVCSTTLRSFQSKQFLCGNHFILPVRELLFTKLNHLEGNTTLNICIACTMHHSISQSKFITVYVRQKENQSFLRVVSNSYMLLLLTPSMIIWSLYLHPYEI